MTELLTPFDVDCLLRLPRGRAERFARSGKLPCIVLPGGDVRFDADAVARWLQANARIGPVSGDHGNAEPKK